MFASTGTGARWASAATAGTSPRSVRITGWMPRASSRSSASAVASFSDSASTVSAAASLPLSLLLSRRRSSESETSCCCAPSWRSRSMRPARVVLGLDDADARDAQLLDARAQVRLQALVVDRERGARGGGVDELRAGGELGVVDDRGDAAAVALDGGPGAARAGLGHAHDVARLVDEELAVGQPVGDRQRAVAEALGEHLADRARGLLGGGEQRARERPEQRAQPAERGDGEDARGDRQRAQHAGR